MITQTIHTRTRSRVLSIAAAAAAAVLLASGCSGSSGSDDGKTIKVAYQKFGGAIQMDTHMKETAQSFEAANPGMKVKFVPIAAQNDDYFAKLALMNRSAATAPDVMYEDTFKIKSDAAAGYLRPLDDQVTKWNEWSAFFDSAKRAGVGEDGKLYGIPIGTDTRALWYNKDLFAKAGLSTAWAPKTWDDVLAAAKTIRATLPGVVPINVYSGKPQGEGSVMQGFEMLHYGTSTGTLYDDSTGKWITGSQGFIDSLGFIRDVYQGGLGPNPEQALDTNISNIVTGEWLPQGRLAIALDGSWLSSAWLDSGPNPWPEWNRVMGLAPMPTQHGQGPGIVSMSGGFTLAVGSQTKNPNKAFEFITDALGAHGSKAYSIAASQVAVRSDIAKDPDYLASNPTAAFFSSLVDTTHFRPATTDYSRVSNAITVAMEAVMTGQQSPEEAAAAYDRTLIGIVGETKTQKAKG